MTAPAAPGAPNRLPLILAVGAGLLLLVFVATQVLGGGDDADDATATTLAPTTSAPPVTTTVPPAPPPAETFESFTTKNPFVPLRIVGGGGTAGGAPAPGGATTTGGATGAAPTGGGPAAGPAATATAPQGGTGTQPATRPSGAGRPTTEPRRGARVALLDVFVEGGRVVANVRVNDTVHKVGEGQVFAANFKVVSLSQADGCGRFLFGDDAFRLCKGEETLK